jgi:hypothetical protein
MRGPFVLVSREAANVRLGRKFGDTALFAERGSYRKLVHCHRNWLILPIRKMGRGTANFGGGGVEGSAEEGSRGNLSSGSANSSQKFGDTALFAEGGSYRKLMHCHRNLRLNCFA